MTLNPHCCIYTESDDSSGLVSCIAGRFNDPNTSDVAFVVEGKKIHVHKAILRMR
ncbi:hypothetical protein GBAR_LOCUS1439 [Geodia barretti]|nr:hypothetical protein GBAR_LOCUS1439 [Geodia barretti]